MTKSWAEKVQEEQNGIEDLGDSDNAASSVAEVPLDAVNDEEFEVNVRYEV